MHRPVTLGLTFLLLWGCGVGPRGDPAPVVEAPEPAPQAERGRLLYEMACVACHTTQAHWRERRLVKAWPDLVHQVTRWQSIAGQNWRREDVEDVAAYLNQRFYKLP